MYLIALISFVALMWEIYRFTHPGSSVKFKEEGKRIEEAKKDENYKSTTKDMEHLVHGCFVVAIGLTVLPMLVGALFVCSTRAPAACMLGLTVFGVLVRSLFKNDDFAKCYTFFDSGLSIPTWIWLIQGAVYPEFNLIQWIGY